jgi:hypothetical protein
MLVGLQAMVSPFEGVAEDVRLTVPVKPFWAVTVTVNWPVELPDSDSATKLYVNGPEPVT